MSKYVRVMDGLKSNASGEEFKLDEIITAKTWNPEEKEPEKMGGFNFSTEDKILRYIFRGDTIYEVIIPDDAGAYDEHFTEFNGVDEPTGENDPDYKKYSSDSGIETDWSLWDAEGEAPSSKAQSSYTIN